MLTWKKYLKKSICKFDLLKNCRMYGPFKHQFMIQNFNFTINQLAGEKEPDLEVDG